MIQEINNRPTQEILSDTRPSILKHIADATGQKWTGRITVCTSRVGGKKNVLLCVLVWNHLIWFRKTPARVMKRTVPNVMPAVGTVM